MKRKIPVEYAYRLINHGPVVLVSTLYRGKPNVCTIAWLMPLDSDVIAIVVSDENYSFKAIQHSGEFAVNIPNKKLVKQVVQCGSVSGEDTDKFACFALTPVRARKIRAPLVKECIGHLECKLIGGERRLAKKYNMFIARVIYARAERGCFRTRWDMAREEAHTLHHLGGNVFAVPSKKKVR